MCLLNVEHCLETSSNWVTNEAIVFVVSNKPVAAAKYDDHSRDNRKSKRLEAKLDCFSWTQSCFPTPQQVSHFNKCWRVIHSFGFCLNYGDLYQVFIIMCLLITLINQRDFTHEREETLARIEEYIVLIVAAVSNGDWPLQLPIHGSDETMIWKLASQRRKCLLLFHLLAKSHALLRTNTNSTKR